MTDDKTERESWLNDWPRMGTSVLMGTSLHCSGCGKFHGITCVAFPAGWKPPEKEPDWPFAEEDCPVCLTFRNNHALLDATVEDLATLPASKLRQALIKILSQEQKARAQKKAPRHSP